MHHKGMMHSGRRGRYLSGQLGECILRVTIPNGNCFQNLVSNIVKYFQKQEPKILFDLHLGYFDPEMLLLKLSKYMSKRSKAENKEKKEKEMQLND